MGRGGIVWLRVETQSRGKQNCFLCSLQARIMNPAAWTSGFSFPASAGSFCSALLTSPYTDTYLFHLAAACIFKLIFNSGHILGTHISASGYEQSALNFQVHHIFHQQIFCLSVTEPRIELRNSCSLCHHTYKQR